MRLLQLLCRSVLAMVVAVVVVLAQPRAAQAHARPIRSIPADKAQLPASPPRIELWFSELLDEGFNAVEVFPASELTAKHRSNLAQGAVTVDATDRTHVTVDVKPLPPGDYAVEWRVLSRDGHSAPGRFTFRVLKAQ